MDKLAPAKWKIAFLDGGTRWKRRWWFDGNIPIGLPIASSVIGQDGTKVTGTAFFDMDNDVVQSLLDPDAVSMLDSLGIHAQIMYPNVAGSVIRILKSSDEALRLISVEIYNDALAEFQADTWERVLGMALLPWWNLDAAVKEIERAHANGPRHRYTNPEEAGLPDMGTSDWDPIWATSPSQICP